MQDAAYKAATVEETQEVEKMGEQIDMCVSLVGSSLNVLMRALEDFEHWRDMVTSQHVLPTNVLSYLTVIASQVCTPTPLFQVAVGVLNRVLNGLVQLMRYPFTPLPAGMTRPSSENMKHTTCMSNLSLPSIQYPFTPRRQVSVH